MTVRVTKDMDGKVALRMNLEESDIQVERTWTHVEASMKKQVEEE